LQPSDEKLTTHITISLGQVWPQWQVIKILKLMKEGNSQWRTEKEKLEREVSSLGNNFCFRFNEHLKFIQISFNFKKKWVFLVNCIALPVAIA
jgi:hypothetical protein